MQIVIRVRRIDVAALVSVLLHLAFFMFMPHKVVSEPPGPVADVPLNVVLAPPQVAPPEPAAPAAPAAPPAAAARPATPPPMIARTPAPLAPKFPTPPPLPPPPMPVPEMSAAPPVDMMAMIEERRAARRAAEAAAARGAPTGSADAATRNLQTLSGREGVGGVFQVLRKSLRSGEFAFNGWRPDTTRRWREVIEVEAKPGEDIDLAMVRRMIALIRTHYSGDFQWESHRLGRTVVLSARVEDQPGLEEFLMKEFFGGPVAQLPPPRRR